MAKRALIIDGDKVRLARERAGHSQSDFALLCGITQPGMSRIESGERNARPPLIATIARQLGVTVDDITSVALEVTSAPEVVTV